MKANNKLLKKLEKLNIQQYSGKIHKDSFLQIGLDFSPAKVITPKILDGTHFDDWVRHKGWPEEYIPLAIYGPDPDDEEQEEIFMEASTSEIEEFFVIKQDEKNYPVFMWSHSAGLEKWAESIEVFIGKLR